VLGGGEAQPAARKPDIAFPQDGRFHRPPQQGRQYHLALPADGSDIRVSATPNSPPASPFLEPSVLAALRNAKSQQFDYAKLIRLCEELNDAYGRANYLSCALLIRAVMNHVPPVFGCQTFAQVTAQCGKSLKAVFERLEDSARPIADLHTHALIRAKESVPTKHQVEPYKASFELLMQEVIARA